jgi:DNA-binding MarR family transcriptional regulator
LANATSRGGSRVYLRLFGVGINEWRMLSLLAIEPGLTAQQICQALELDKAAASRSVRVLEKSGLVDALPSPQARRSKLLNLTAKGLDLQARILSLALDREQLLLAGISPEEKCQIIGLLGRMVGNLSRLENFENALVPKVEEASGGSTPAGGTDLG